MTNKKQLLNWGIKIIGIALFIYLVSNADMREISQNLKKFRLPQLLLIETISFCIILTKTFRFKVLLNQYSAPIPFNKSLQVYGTGMFLSAVTPGRIGDLGKIFYLKQLTDCSFTKGFYISILDRLLDLSMLVIAALIGLVFMGKMTTALILGFSCIILITVVCIKGKDILEWILNHIYKQRLPGNTPEVKPFENLKLVLPWIVSLIPNLLIFYQMILISHIAGFQLNVLLLSGTLALGNLISLLPITISGLGTREATFAAILPRYGLTTSESISLSIAFFILNNIGIMLIGLVIFLTFRSTSMKMSDAR